MITVTKQENGVLFTFENSDKYLYGSGTIEVPFNSLSIIQDESDMITFRKSASNDIFISARYDDMGYVSKEDAVNALKGILFAESEGGGGSVDPDEVRTIVEEETSGMSEDIATLETNKFDGASYNSANHTIIFTANGVQKASIDASDFIKDGMVSNVEIANNNLVITFNTDAGKSPISIPLTNFFDPTILDDYFTKSEVNAALSQKLDVSAYTPTDLSQYWTSAQTQNAINEATSGIPSSSVIDGLRNDVNTLSGVVDTKLDASAYTPTDLSGYYTKTETDNLLGEKADLTALTQHTSDTTIHVTSAEKAAWNAKQDALTAGTNIAINNNVISADLSNYLTKSEVTTALADKMDVSGMSAYATTATTYSKTEVDNAITAATSTKQDTLVSGTNIKTLNGESILGEGNITIEGGGGAGLDDDTQQLISTAFNDLNDRKADLTELSKYQKKGDYVKTSTLADYMTNASFDEYATAKERIISGALNDLDNRMIAVESGGTGGGITSGEVQTMIDDSLDIYWTSAQTQTAIDAAKAYYISFATIATTGIRDEDWDGIVAAIDDHRPIYAGYPRTDGGILYYGVECMDKNVSNTQIVLISSDNTSHYFYTFTKNGSNDYSYTVSTKPYVPDITTAITSGSTDAQVPTAKAVYDATQSGGGATYSAGTNISIDTGNTISCTLPITAKDNIYEPKVMIGYHDQQYIDYYVKANYGVSIGFTNYINGQRSVCLGSDNQANGYSSVAANGANTAQTNYSFACGNRSKTSNDYEFGCGRFNNSVSSSSTFGDSGNTLFSVGNGTGTSARHNAFEIRQNGDIYVNDGTNDVRLQDTILALGGLKLVKLTQAAYDALATKDSSTLYIISD